MEKDVVNTEIGVEKLHHLKIDAGGLNKDLVYPYRAVIEASIKKENFEWSLLKNLIAAFFATKMRDYGKKNPKYAQYISGVNELGVLAQEGKKVNTIINTLVFDYHKLWIGLNILSHGRLFKNMKIHKELELYPITNFDIHLKQDFLYALFEETFPGLIRKLMKNKVMIYLTSDFNFAVSANILDIEGVNEQVKTKQCGDVIELNDKVKLYLFDIE